MGSRAVVVFRSAAPDQRGCPDRLPSALGVTGAETGGARPELERAATHRPAERRRDVVVRDYSGKTGAPSADGCRVLLPITWEGQCRTSRSKENEQMFERFTDRARRVVVLAQEEARMLNHN